MIQHFYEFEYTHRAFQSRRPSFSFAPAWGQQGPPGADPGDFRFLERPHYITSERQQLMIFYRANSELIL